MQSGEAADERKSNYSSEYLSYILCPALFKQNYHTQKILEALYDYNHLPKNYDVTKNTRQGRERTLICTNGVGQSFDVLPRQFTQLLICVFFVSMKF